MVIIDDDNHWERGREGHSGRSPVAGILLFLADIVVVPPERLVRRLGALGF
jgi:hypothetical protein